MANAKLRIYHKHGYNQGNLDREEYFDSLEEAIARYRELFVKEDWALNPTVWVADGEHWDRVLGL